MFNIRLRSQVRDSVLGSLQGRACSIDPDKAGSLHCVDTVTCINQSGLSADLTICLPTSLSLRLAARLRVDLPLAEMVGSSGMHILEDSTVCRGVDSVARRAPVLMRLQEQVDERYEPTSEDILQLCRALCTAQVPTWKQELRDYATCRFDAGMQRLA